MMRAATLDSLRRVTFWLAVALWLGLLWATWFIAPDWQYQPDVTAPLTRKILFFHPASAWTAFGAYFVVFGASVATLNERTLRYDAPAQAAAEVGFAAATIALVTGTLWGVQEWADSGQSALATVFTEPKVLVVLVMWLSLAALLLLRRSVDGIERRARLSAAFGVLGFVTVPLSFATSRILQTSLHPDIAGPGKNPDAAVGGEVGAILGLSLLAFLALWTHLGLLRFHLLRLRDRLDRLAADAQDPLRDHHDR